MSASHVVRYLPCGVTEGAEQTLRLVGRGSLLAQVAAGLVVRAPPQASEQVEKLRLPCFDKSDEAIWQAAAAQARSPLRGPPCLGRLWHNERIVRRRGPALPCITSRRCEPMPASSAVYISMSHPSVVVQAPVSRAVFSGDEPISTSSVSVAVQVDRPLAISLPSARIPPGGGPSLLCVVRARQNISLHRPRPRLLRSIAICPHTPQQQRLK